MPQEGKTLPAIPRNRARAVRDMLRRAALGSIWIAAAVTTVYLWRTSPELQSVPAVAENIEHQISADTTARILHVTVEPGQAVRAGDLLVVLDPAPLTGTIGVYAAEIERHAGELRAEAATIDRETLVEERSFATAVDSAEIELLRARIEADAARAELAGVRAQEKQWAGLVERRVAPREELDKLRGEREVLTRQVASLDKAIAGFEAKVEEARQRLIAFRATMPAGAGEAGPAARDLLGGVRGEVEVARAQVAELETLRQRLLLRAPADGVVQQVFQRAGAVAVPGEPVLTIRGAAPRRVFAYVDDARAARLRVGARVDVHEKSRTLPPLPGRVTALSGGVAPYPLQLQNNTNQNLWGREIVIELEPGVESTLVPGQLLAVTFDERSDGGPARVAAAAPDADAQTEAGALRALVVPTELQRLTRVEPSGIVWSAALDGYLVASDDTGWPDAADHAPWLLRLTADGAFLPRPVVVAGVPKLNDVEALAWAPDGKLLLLSSQSMSKRGKRPKHRTLLVAAEPAGDGLNAVQVISLARALADNADPAWHAALGLAAPADRQVDPALDVEGLAVRDGAALLGLKAPRDAEGRAILWRLDGLDRFLADGRLAPDQLRLHGRLRLAGGLGATGGGITELLTLPDGGLLVLSNDDPDGERGRGATGGAAWLVPRGATPDERGELPVQLVRRFDGATPEGAALTPAGDRVLVVFDRGEQTPLSTTLALPTAAAGAGVADPLAER